MKKVTADIMPLGQVPEKDANNFMDWAYEMREQTQFSMDVMKHPRMCMTRALMDGEPALYLPIQPVLMFDVLTPDPKLTPMQRSICMYRIGQLLENQVMPELKICDAYFYTPDDREVHTCSRHGWEALKGFTLMRKRIKP